MAEGDRRIKVIIGTGFVSSCRPTTFPNSPPVKTQRAETEFLTGASYCDDDGGVQSPAVQWMRGRDHCATPGAATPHALKQELRPALWCSIADWDPRRLFTQLAHSLIHRDTACRLLGVGATLPCANPMKKSVYHGEWMEVVTEEVELPNGHRIALDIVRHPGAAAVVPFVTETDILVLRQYRYAAGGYLYEVPAGKLDAGEPAELCAARELEEEAGQRAGQLEKLGAIWTTPGFTDERIHLFAAYELEAVPQRLEKDEVLEVIRMPLRAALEMVWSGELSDAKSALALIHAGHREGILD